MSLSDVAVRKAKPRDKAYKLSDSQGLYLFVSPSGLRAWRMDYRYEQKRKTLTFGQYPAVGLADARQRVTEARKLLSQGEDPAARKKLLARQREIERRNSFDVIADEYIARLESTGRATATLNKNRWLKSLVRSEIRAKPITDISSADILEVLQDIEASGRRDTAHTVRSFVGSVFRFAISTLRAENDPTYALRNALLPPKVTPRTTLTDSQQIGALMASIEDYDGWVTITAALRFNALTFARPGEVRHARWDDIDLEDGIWRIPAERMKMRRPHDVPLSTQAAVLLNRVRKVSGRGDLIFPSIRSSQRSLSENAMNSALRRMGYTKDEMTAHGFRAMASTILNERGYREDVIEAQLAHVEPNKVRRAYNRARYWDERVQLMQDWADLLDSFKSSS
ncbi:Prophage CP4-57 integrase (plasmid) [Aminobacter sp. MSH1]|uniref:tyrosine-type recombinase/integrase n=1 Tax=Aminobacter sp. MSH1 TaxID=374606 RepID=UPI0009DC56AD|nr:integrase arm-type DNA-binding domain-containing protein [Aminobacter sp. MSH1]ARD70037.1 Prophage CP4-57 integrase [Aminobacter sp. MSH1]